MEAISILIADDHKLIRDTWSFILNTDNRFKVVAECSNGEEAIEQAKQKRPQIVLMDINMTPVSGLEATRQIRKVSPGSKIIGVSMHSQPAYAKKMLQIGAKGYVAVHLGGGVYWLGNGLYSSSFMVHRNCLGRL